jgi:hypothetical protein
LFTAISAPEYILSGLPFVICCKDNGFIPFKPGVAGFRIIHYFCGNAFCGYGLLSISSAIIESMTDWPNN